jgi:nucleotide-binding universal stress UspA family protein
MAASLARDGLPTRWRLPPREASLRSSESEEGLTTGSIICGVDDSESAKGAARVARQLSAQLGVRLVFVRVVHDGSRPWEIGAVAARLHDLAEGATEVDGGAQWLVEVGHPADRLVAVAEKEAARLIVVGSTGPRSSLLGSISADVSRRAPCPVVVVAPGADVSLTNGNGTARVSGRTGFPGLFDDGYTGPAPVSTPLGGPVPRTETEQRTISTRATSPAASSASALAWARARSAVPRDAITRRDNATGRNGRAVRGASPIPATALSQADAYVGERRWLGGVASG